MKPDINGNMKIYILNGILFSIMLNSYKPFAVKFLERMGGSEFHATLYSSLPALIAIFAILPGAFWLMRFSNKKSIMTKLFLISRIFVLLLVFLPFLPIEMRPVLFLILISSMNFPESISQSAFQSFLGDIFPPDKRSTAISLRSKFSVPAMLVVTLLVGQLLVKLPQTDAQRTIIYQILFAASFVIGLLEIYCFTRFREPDKRRDQSVPLKEAFNKIFRNKSFWGFAGCSLIFHFGWQMAWPLFNIYYIYVLKADEFWLGVVFIALPVGMFFSYSFWDKIIKRSGNSIVTVITTLGMVVNPIFVAISPNVYIITLLTLLSGFFTAGANTVLLNSLLEVVPEKNRMLYVGVYNTLLNISLAVSPFVAHAFFSKGNIFIALIAAAGVRFIGSSAFFLRNRRLQIMKTKLVLQNNQVQNDF